MTATAPLHETVEPPEGTECDIWEGHPLHRVVYTIPRSVLNRTGDPLRSPVLIAAANLVDGWVKQ